MEFVKKNWSKMVIAVIALTGAILMLIPIITAPEFNFVGGSQLLGPMLFFIGLFAQVVLKMFDKTKQYAMYALVAGGLLATIFLCIGLIGFSSTDPKGGMGSGYAFFKNLADTFKPMRSLSPAAKKAYDGALTGAYSILFSYVSMLFVMGLIPLVRGTKKVVEHFFCKACNFRLSLAQQLVCTEKVTKRR